MIRIELLGLVRIKIGVFVGEIESSAPMGTFVRKNALGLLVRTESSVLTGTFVRKNVLGLLVRTESSVLTWALVLTLFLRILVGILVLRESSLTLGIPKSFVGKLFSVMIGIWVGDKFPTDSSLFSDEDLPLRFGLFELVLSQFTFPPILFFNQSLPLFTCFSTLWSVASFILSAILSNTFLHFSLILSFVFPLLFSLLLPFVFPITFPLPLLFFLLNDLTLPFFLLNDLTLPFFLLNDFTLPFVLLNDLTLPFVLLNDLTLPFFLLNDLTLPFVLLNDLILLFVLLNDLTLPFASLNLPFNFPSFLTPLQKLPNPFFRHFNPFLIANSFAFFAAIVFNPATPPVLTMAPILSPTFAILPIFINFFRNKMRLGAL